MTLCVSCRGFLGMNFNIYFENLDSFETFLGSELWGDDFSSILDLARLYGKNLSIPQSQSQTSSGELGDVGDGGRLRCLHGKADTTISCVCTSVGSTQFSGCMIYRLSTLAAV